MGPEVKAKIQTVTIQNCPNYDNRPQYTASNGDSTRPLWVDMDIPEHGKDCISKDQKGASEIAKTFGRSMAEMKAHISTVGNYCGVQFESKEEEDSSHKLLTTTTRTSAEGVYFHTIDSYVEENDEQICTHVLVAWNDIFCGTKRFVCEPPHITTEPKKKGD